MKTLLLLSFAATSVAPAANMLLNPSFEADDASAAPFNIRSSTQPTNWTQFGDGVDIIHNDYTQGPTVLLDPSDGDHFLDLNQGGSLGGIFQDVPVTVGTSYRLTLDAAQWATNSGGVVRFSLIDPITSFTLNTADYAVTPAWVTQTLDATATSNRMRIQVQSVVSPQAAPGLDNLNFDVVPEPSTAILAGLSGLLFLCRRRQSTHVD